jgi:hypothetical protein
MPLPQLHSFALWLPKHAALVKSITVDTGYLLPTDDVHGLPADSHVDEVQRVLLQALQLAGTKSAPPAAAPASATAAVSASVGGHTAAQQQQQEGWRLASFSSDLPRAELLAALPAHSLTHLDIYAGSCSTRSGEGSNAIAASLARLTSLQHLELWIGTDGIPVSVLAGVAQLSQLTALTLQGWWDGIKQPLEQLLAQQLPLRKLDVSMRDDIRDSPQPVLDIKHLTTLEQLSTVGQLPEGSALPAQLKQLQLEQCSASNFAAVMPLQQLQRLNLYIVTDSAGEVARLAQLPALQHLTLSYTTLRLAAATAHVWRQLPQLQELHVKEMDDNDPGMVVQTQSILAGIAAATSLTHLHLHSWSLYKKEMSDVEMADIIVCPRLAGLSRLQKLYIHSPMGGSDPFDALALTALTGLTHLDLAGSSSLVATDSATALAHSLTRLRHLDMGECSPIFLGSTQLMLALGQLTQLTFVNIRQWYDSQLTVGGLMQLTGLRHLEGLEVSRSPEITKEVLGVFLAAVRGQKKSC